MEELRSGRKLYGECMRNHAAALGAYASDGCGEFSADEGSISATHFCSACGCHRNFHRKLLDVSGYSSYYPSETAAMAVSDNRSDGRRRFRTKFTGEQKAQMRSFADRLGWLMPRRSDAEEEIEVEKFCAEIGVSRHVFRVWMHNHKGNGVAGGGGGAAPANSSSATNNSDGDVVGCSGGGGGGGRGESEELGGDGKSGTSM
ncbi:zinc-finger homeodomain protein 11-like [Phalaenopsis equestris]|uniref:zinc-finger homeodomain protein 11-like n=1 Tax=Phalaenopsis equestris TaxID=78828 RepID=UPI0009E3BF79|nr:zinc-finger homeodomain protein 11-like [Phalaenopsis equestris]